MVSLHDALEYHDRGFAVVPAKGKRPEVAWSRFRKSGPSESEIRQWFGDDNQSAIAVLNGKPSGGLVCRDFDDMGAYDAWAAAHPLEARTLPTVATPRPGRHVYCRASVDQVRAATGSKSTIIDLGDGELRGGGINLLPPSVTTPAAKYRWLIPLDNNLPAVDLSAIGFIPPRFTPPVQHRELRRTQRTQGHSMSSMLHGGVPSEAVEFAVVATLPVREGERHRRLFDLARELKAIPELVAANLADLKPIVRRWHQAALPVIGTKPFDDTWGDFAESWGKVKFPKGQEPILMIAARAQEADLPAVAAEYESPGVKLLVRICRELQRHHGDKPFHLDCRTAGKLIGVEHTVAWRWLRLLQHDGVLKLESTGSHATHRANCYRYLPSL